MNPMSKRLFVLLLIVLVFLTGCGKTGNNEPPELTNPEEKLEETMPSTENEADPNEEDRDILSEGEDESTQPNKEESENESEEETIFEVKESKYFTGWKELTLKDYSYTTEDWESYSFRENSPLIGYKLHFPGNWELEFTVFYNEKGEKVAELYPPIMMTSGQKLLENWEISSDCELISKDDIQVGELEGVKIVARAYPHSGDIAVWYPHTYYLTDGQKVFAMSFYALELDERNQREFDNIVESFEFID